MSDVDDVVDGFFKLRRAIFTHVGYREDWRGLPIRDARAQFWTVDPLEREWVKFSPDREALEHWLADDDYGSYGDKLYRNEIYTQRHLPKWVYRGKELTLVVVDTHTDGNQYLQLFRNCNEVHPGDSPKLLERAMSVAPRAPSLNQAIDDMIEGDRKTPADGLLEKVRSMCVAVPPGELRIAIDVHRTNCRQPNCPVLATMEHVAKVAG